MTMLTPDDPGSGRLFFWTRQGISLQQLYDIIDEAIAAGGSSGGGGGTAGGGITGGDINAIDILDSTDVGRAVLTATGLTFGDRQAASRAALAVASGAQVDANTNAISSLSTTVSTLSTSVSTLQGGVATVTATEIHIYCPGDVERPRNALGVVPSGSQVVFHKLTAPTIGGPYAQVNDGWEPWDG